MNFIFILKEFFADVNPRFFLGLALSHLTRLLSSVNLNVENLSHQRAGRWACKALKRKPLKRCTTDENRYLLALTQGEVQDEPENMIKTAF
jgi:hypothetical protein